MLNLIHHKALTDEEAVDYLINGAENEVLELHTNILYLRYVQRNTQKKAEQAELGHQIRKNQEAIKENKRYIEYLRGLRADVRKDAKSLSELAKGKD